MKKMSKLTALALAIILVFGLSSCSGGGSKAYTVGICQLTQHAALDEATQGFMDALEKALPGQVEFDHQNASNDLSLCSTIVTQFVAADVDLILTNATPALQTAAATTVSVPILSTSVTEYSAALDLKDFNGVIGGNISGTSDLAPLDDQAAMVKEWFPDAQKVALLYCSSEANSRYQVDGMKEELEKLGYTCKYFSFTDSNDLFGVVSNAVNYADVIYVPTDNTIASNTSIIDNCCRDAKIPVIGGEKALCSGCGVATLSVSYYDLGYTTGEMAAKILTGQADISEMPIEYAEYSKLYNAEICADLGLTPPDGYTAITAD